MTDRELMSMAKEASMNAYIPYSRFAVGAAIECTDGTVYTGCNVENAAYSVSVCAERTAFVKAVSEGVRDFTAIAVVGGKSPEAEGYSWPCGVCRQMMREFCDPERFVIITAKNENDYICRTLAELLPESFGPGNLV